MFEIEYPRPCLISTIKPFLVGSLTGCTAASLLQPIDTLKVSLSLTQVLIQAKKEDAGRSHINLSPLHVARTVVRRDGFQALYRGLDASLLRQFFYCGGRLGIYKRAEEAIKEKEGRHMTFAEKANWSLASGAIGSLTTTPTDVALIRFQADSTLPPMKRRNYRNVFDAFGQIYREEGLRGLWRGATPNVARAMSTNCSLLVTYNEAKEGLMRLTQSKEETLNLRLLSSCVTGVAISIVSLPFDNVKTKIMRMKPSTCSTYSDLYGEYPYRGFIDCFAKSIRNEGVTALWVGLSTYYMRIAPHASVMVLVQDFLHDQFRKYNY